MPKQVIIPKNSHPPIAPYVPATKANNIVYVSGTLPLDEHQSVVSVGDAKAQTHYVLTTIKKVIEEAGGTMNDITFNSIFIKDWNDYTAINEVYAEYFPTEKPARYCIQCGLVKPDALIEISSIAHLE